MPFLDQNISLLLFLQLAWYRKNCSNEIIWPKKCIIQIHIWLMQLFHRTKSRIRQGPSVEQNLKFGYPGQTPWKYLQIGRFCQINFCRSRNYFGLFFHPNQFWPIQNRKMKVIFGPMQKHVIWSRKKCFWRKEGKGKSVLHNSKLNHELLPLDRIVLRAHS